MTQAEALVCLIKISGLRTEVQSIEHELNYFVDQALAAGFQNIVLVTMRERSPSTSSSRVRSRYETELSEKITELVAQRQKIYEEIAGLQEKLNALLPDLEASIGLIAS